MKMGSHDVLKSDDDGYFMINSAISALLVSFLIETLVLRIMASVLVLLAVYYLQVALVGRDGLESKDTSLLPTRGHTDSGLLVLGVVASFAVTLIPAATQIPTGASFGTQLLGTLSPLIWTRLIAAYYLTTIFPGFQILLLMPSSQFTKPEKLALSIGLSYVITGTLGLVLLKLTSNLSVPVLVLSVWLFVFAARTVGVFLQRSRHSVATQSLMKEINSVNVLLLVSGTFTIFISYLVTLSSGPLSAALNGDITVYIVGAVDMTLGKIPTYLTSSPLFYTFIATVKALSGLNYWYSYVGLQFMTVIFPLSFYFMIRRFSPSSARSRAVAVVLLIGTGFGFLAVVASFWSYTGGGLGALNVLYELWGNAILHWIPYQFYYTPLAYGLIFISMGLFAEYFDRAGNAAKPTLCLAALLAVFSVSTLYTHSIFEFSIFLTACLLLVCVRGRLPSLKELATLIVPSLALFTMLEALTGLYTHIFLDYFYTFAYVVGYNVGLSLALPAVAVLLVVGIVIYYSRPIAGALFQTKGSVRIPRHWPAFLTLRRVALSLAFGCVAVALCAWYLQWGQLNLNNSVWDPWYILVLLFGICPVIFALGIKSFRLTGIGFALSTVWLLATLALAMASVVLPAFFPPGIWGSRMLTFALYPIIALAALSFGESSCLRSVPKSHCRKILTTLLVLAVALSIVTTVYGSELYYSLAVDSPHPIPDAELEALGWLSKYSSPSDNVLTLTSHDANSVETIASRHSLSLDHSADSWPLQVLMASTDSSFILSLLSSLSVRYVYVSDSEELQNTTTATPFALGLIQNLPIAFEKGHVAVFLVPSFNEVNQSDDYYFVNTIDALETYYPLWSVSPTSITLASGVSAWQALSGNWTLLGDTLEGKGVAPKDNIIVTPYSAESYNLTFSAKCQIGAPQYVWVYLRFSSLADNLRLWISAKSYELSESVGGLTTAISAGSLGFQLDMQQWNNYTFTVRGRDIIVTIDGLAAIAASTSVVGGNVAFSVYEGYTVDYSGIAWTLIPRSVDLGISVSNYQDLAFYAYTKGVQFSPVPTEEVALMGSGGTCLLPSDVPSMLNSTYISALSRGVNFVVITSPEATANGHSSLVFSNLLSLEPKAYSNVTDLSLSSTTVTLTPQIVEAYDLNSSYGMEVLAWYGAAGTPVTPLVARLSVGRGSVTFIFQYDSLQLSASLMASVIDVALAGLPSGTNVSLAPDTLSTELSKLPTTGDFPRLLESSNLSGEVFGLDEALVTAELGEFNTTSLDLDASVTGCLNISLNLRGSTLSLTSGILDLEGLLSVHLDNSSFGVERNYGLDSTALLSLKSGAFVVEATNASLVLLTENNTIISLEDYTGTITLTLGYLGVPVSLLVTSPSFEVSGTLNMTGWLGYIPLGNRYVIGFSTHSKTFLEGTFYIEYVRSLPFPLFKIEIAHVFVLRHDRG